jgi:signal transduction histidine kinase
MFSHLPIKTKLQLAFFLFGLAIIVAIGLQAYQSGRRSLEESSFHRLTSIRETKKSQVESYIKLLRDQVVTIAESRQALNAILNLRSHGSVTLPSENTGAHGQNAFQGFLTRFNLKGIFLVDHELRAANFLSGGGAVNEKHEAQNMEKPGDAIIETALHVLTSINREETYVRDFAFSSNSSSEVLAFIGTQVYLDSRTIGACVIAVGIDDLNAIMTSSSDWEQRGFGKSGESYIVAADHLMRNNSRFLLETPSTYFEALSNEGLPSPLIERMKKMQTTILLQPVQTKATHEALSGNTNTEILEDYRGVVVLSSYSPLELGDLNWVIIVEIDKNEAFAAIHSLQESIILYAMVIFLIATIAGYLVARSISHPISQLASATEQVGKGDFSRKVHVRSRDEIGELAGTFNSMADNLQRMTGELHSEVDVRLKAERELKESHVRLRNLSVHLQTVREQERQSFARDIHDELGQALTALKMETAVLEKRIGQDDMETKAQLADMEKLIHDTIISVKRITSELRPGILDDLGLSAAIEWQLGEFRKRTGTTCNIVFSPQVIIVEPEVSTAIFRVFQESLTNIARHAAASSVDVSLVEEEGCLELNVLDDGVGISDDQINNSTSFGILGIRERMLALGGVVTLTGMPGHGTELRAVVPLAQENII